MRLKWNPKTEVRSSLSPRLNVNDYKTDYAIDFEGKNGEISIGSNKVSGKDNFIQKFKKVLLSTNTPIITYGLYHLLPKSSDQTQFDEECSVLASALVKHKFSDTRPDSPNGLGYTIEAIRSMEYDFNEDILYVTMKVTGIDSDITVDVPVFVVRHKQ